MTFDELLTNKNYEEVDEMIYSFTRIQKEIVEQSRWTTYFREIRKDLETGRFVEFHYQRGSTEQQDIDQSYMDWSVQEVFPVEKTIIEYRPR